MLNVIANTISGVVSSDFVTSCLPENSKRVLNALKTHFQGQQDPLHEMLNEAYASTLKSLNSALDPKLTALSSADAKNFRERFERSYWTPFTITMSCSNESDRQRLKAVCGKGCRSLIDKVDEWTLPIDHQELASLLFEVPQMGGVGQSTQRREQFEREAKRDIQRQIQRAHIDNHATDFLLFNDLLYSCLIGRFQETVKRSPLIQSIFTIYQQNKISVDLDVMKVNFEESQRNLRADLHTLTHEMTQLAAAVAKAPHQVELITRLSEVASSQSAIRADLDQFDQRFSRVESSLVGISSELFLFHESFNSFAEVCERKLDQINEGVSDIRGKVDHLIDLVQTQGTASFPAFNLVQKEQNLENLEPTPSESLRLFLDEQILQCIRVFTESQEREYFIEAAMLNLSTEESTLILKEVLHESKLEREKEVMAMIKDHMAPSLTSGYFSSNEVENILYIAERHKLPKDKVMQLIKDECLRTGCVNAPEVAERFRKYLELSFPPNTPFNDISPFLDWAERNKLSRRDARAILRAHCAPHSLPYSYN